MARPLPDREHRARTLLRLGAAQLLFLGTPAHAAVGEMVALARPPHDKLVNAVLRRIAREGEAMLASQDAARLNTPPWLWRSWTDSYGDAACRAIAQAHLGEAPLDITVKSDPEDWAKRLHARVLPTGSLRLAPGGAISALPGYDEGGWWVQDMAAALPARLLGPLRGKRVIDLCAAPGGKTAQLAAGGAQVTAVDRASRRLERLGANLARLGLEADMVVADAVLWRPSTPADAVLLDAPCGGTGSIRRHPDIQRLKTPEDVARMGAAQSRLLRAALEMVRPGGLVVYCTCSLETLEGEAQVAGLLQGGAPARRLPIEPEEVGGLAELIDANGDLRAHPGKLEALGGLDGFHVARLARV
jgi:16S rRNA (cytosine967-C5)-methyltransferase